MDLVETFIFVATVRMRFRPAIRCPSPHPLVPRWPRERAGRPTRSGWRGCV